MCMPHDVCSCCRCWCIRMHGMHVLLLLRVCSIVAKHIGCDSQHVKACQLDLTLVRFRTLRLVLRDVHRLFTRLASVWDAVSVVTSMPVPGTPKHVARCNATSSTAANTMVCFTVNYTVPHMYCCLLQACLH
mgnify:CR=1 FL=1